MSIGPKDFERKVDELWSVDESRPCFTCRRHLLKFALARPQDFEFLTATDMADPDQLGFAGIPEWDTFLGQFSACESCNG